MRDDRDLVGGVATERVPALRQIGFARVVALQTADCEQNQQRQSRSISSRCQSNWSVAVRQSLAAERCADWAAQAGAKTSAGGRCGSMFRSLKKVTGARPAASGRREYCRSARPASPAAGIIRIASGQRIPPGRESSRGPLCPRAWCCQTTPQGVKLRGNIIASHAVSHCFSPGGSSRVCGCFERVFSRSCRWTVSFSGWSIWNTPTSRSRSTSTTAN